MPQLPFLKDTGLKVLAGLALFTLGAALGWYLHAERASGTFNVVRDASTSYTFIAPFLLLEVPESTDAAYQPVKQAFAAYVASALASKKASDISVYYRDLDTSQWVGINTQEKFSPASMLKVVTLITILHAAESDPSILTKNITIGPVQNDEGDSQDFYPPAHPVKTGETYTVQDLLAHLIIESDNTANGVLTQFIGTEAIKKTYDDLHLPMPDSQASDADTAQQYSHLYRTLYSATYLSPRVSEQVLDLLSRTTFDQGLSAGAPTGTLIAHKFGERTTLPATAGGATLRQLHDCGIVYYPGHPYFICIMTRGTDFPALASVIKDISALAWKQTDARYTK